jgi:hypothetical protein
MACGILQMVDPVGRCVHYHYTLNSPLDHHSKAAVKQQTD